MNIFTSTAITLCFCCVVCSLLGILAPRGAAKKVFYLVLGMFLICSTVLPIKEAVANISLEYNEFENNLQNQKSPEEVLDEKIIKQTGDNFVLALSELFKEEKLYPNNITADVSKDDNNDIRIDSIDIYISKDDDKNINKYITLTFDNTGIKPSVIME